MPLLQFISLHVGPRGGPEEVAVLPPEGQIVGRVDELVHQSHRLIHYSPSQLSKYGLPVGGSYLRTGCRRKWWFEYVAKKKPPPTKSQAKGTRTHGVLEHAVMYQGLPRQGVEIEVDRIRKKRAVIEPDDVLRGEAALLEMSRVELESRGFTENPFRDEYQRPDTKTALSWFIATMHDLYRTGLVHVEAEMQMPLPPTARFLHRIYKGAVDLIDFRDPQRTVITDYKTLSDLKYARNEYELETDHQMLSYARWALGFKPTPRVLLRHIAIPTKGRARAVECSAEVSAEHVERHWQTYLPVLQEMDETRLIPSAAEVPSDGTSNGECERYGGCPHSAECAAAMFAGVPRRLDVNIGEKLDGVLQHINQSQQGAQGAQPQQGAQGAQPQQPQLPQMPPQQQQPLPQMPQLPQMPPQGVQQQTPMQGLEAIRQLGLPQQQPQQSQQPQQLQQPHQPQMPQMPQVTGPTPAMPNPPTAGLSGQSDDVVQQVARQNAGAPHTSRIKILMVDCVPLQGVQSVPFEVWIAPALEALRQEHGHDWQHHKFRHGPGFVVEKVNSGQVPEYMTVRTGTPIADVALQALMARADLIVGR